MLRSEQAPTDQVWQTSTADPRGEAALGRERFLVLHHETGDDAADCPEEEHVKHRPNSLSYLVGQPFLAEDVAARSSGVRSRIAGCGTACGPSGRGGSRPALTRFTPTRLF